METKCDAKCQYANPEQAADCKCECAGKNHGQGTDTRVWEAKAERLSKTRKAFRRELNAKEPRSGTRLYRHNREEFDKQYAEWSGKPMQEQLALDPAKEGEDKSITTVHQSGSEVTVIKDQQVGDDTYSHVRRSNGKTEYRKNDKLITKAQLPTELGW